MTQHDGVVNVIAMRILFRSLPAFGHLYPLMPLAYAARAAGHDVVFSTGAEFVGRVDALGFPAVSAGVPLERSRFDRFGPEPPLTAVDGHTDWDVVGQLFEQAAISTADALIPLIPEIAPDLVVYEQVDTGAAIAAARAGIPSVSHSIVRAMSAGIHGQMFRAPARALEARYGLGGTVDLAEPELIVDTYPPSQQLLSATTDPRRITMRPAPFGEPSASVPGWIGTHSGPLVYVTVGTVRGYTDALRTVVDGLADFAELDVDVLVATGPLDPAELGPLPPRVRAEPFVNFADLLPHVDLMVHHGGCGTTTGAWVQGIPQLVWPHGADQYINADAVTASGTGLALDTPTSEQVGKFTVDLLSQAGYRTAAESVRDEIAMMPDPADVLHEILRRLAR